MSSVSSNARYKSYSKDKINHFKIPDHRVNLGLDFQNANNSDAGDKNEAMHLPHMCTVFGNRNIAER